MKQRSTITFKLIPGRGCEISIDGQVVETVPVKGHTARLAALGYKASSSRYGFSATGKTITKRGK